MESSPLVDEGVHLRDVFAVNVPALSSLWSEEDAKHLAPIAIEALPSYFASPLRLVAHAFLAVRTCELHARANTRSTEANSAQPDIWNTLFNSILTSHLSSSPVLMAALPSLSAVRSPYPCIGATASTVASAWAYPLSTSPLQMAPRPSTPATCPSTPPCAHSAGSRLPWASPTPAAHPCGGFSLCVAGAARHTRAFSPSPASRVAV